MNASLGNTHLSACATAPMSSRGEHQTQASFPSDSQRLSWGFSGLRPCLAAVQRLGLPAMVGHHGSRPTLRDSARAETLAVRSSPPAPRPARASGGPARPGHSDETRQTERLDRFDALIAAVSNTSTCGLRRPPPRRDARLGTDILPTMHRAPACNCSRPVAQCHGLAGGGRSRSGCCSLARPHGTLRLPRIARTRWRGRLSNSLT